MMAMELNLENAKKAFIDVLVRIGINVDVVGGWDLFAGKEVYTIVPQEFHDTLPSRFLQSAKSVCTESPYSWTVENSHPDIDSDTTLQSLFGDWFTRIIS